MTTNLGTPRGVPILPRWARSGKARPSLTRGFVALSLIASLAFGPVARAGGGDSREIARAHYARGLELAGQRGYEGALREFNEAYASSPEFAVLFNIGQAHVALDHTREAVDALTKYLRDGGDRVPSGRRVQVTAQIARLESRLAVLAAEEAAAAAEAARSGIAPGQPPLGRIGGTLTVRCSEPGIKLTLDAMDLDPAGAARGIPVAAGPHRFTFALPGRRFTDQTLDVPAGASTVVICPALAPAAPESQRAALGGPRGPLDGPPVFAPDLGSPSPSGSSALLELRGTTFGYGLVGLGVALGGAATGVLLWNRDQSRQSDADLAYLTTMSNYDRAREHNRLADSIHFGNVLTVSLAIAAVASLSGGIYLWRRYRKSGETSGEASQPGARAATPSGLWHTSW